MSEKKFRELKIDEELRDLLPPLTADEYNQLEENVKRDGCIDYIVTWKDYIVDGHNRYGICKKYKYGFDEFKLAYDTKDEVIQWMLDTQLGRRNLTDVQRIIIANKYKETIARLARENQKKGGGDKVSAEAQAGFVNSQKVVEPIDTSESPSTKVEGFC